MSINPQHEISPSALTRDTRSTSAQFFSALFQPANFRNFLFAFIALQLYLPGLWPLWAIMLWVLVWSFQDQKFIMPLRMPKDVGGLDRTDYIEFLIEEAFFGLARKSRLVRQLLVAGGILYLGYMRSNDLNERGRELWLTNSDCRTHMFMAGTTGSGKSETLLGLVHNSICWGSGVSMCDGKADSSLPFCVWSLARRHGIEDDCFILNYLTGGTDPFKRLVEEEEGNLSDQPFLAQSNSYNCFAEGSADFLLQLMASLLPNATGDAAQWQEKALNMMDALLRTLCYKRAKGELEISIGVIRHYLALPNLVQFYIEGKAGKIPELAFLPIKAYFETGLPGFNSDLANDSSKWDPEVFNQHGYLTGQFARTLGMMMDTYGYIFKDRYPDIDMKDVLLNNRILVAMIPSMEKSASEAAALGKLYVSSIRLLMAQNLGYRVEGTQAEVLDIKATNSPNPSVIIFDEVAFYFAQGMAVMFAQARSLGFMMAAAVQDIQGVKRSEAGDEAASMIACTRVKWTLALEDPEDTFELIKKAGGEAYYSMLSGHDATVGTFSTSNQAQMMSSVERRDRITLDGLKGLNQGEGMVLFKNAVIPSASYYIPDEHKKTATLKARINRFLQIERPHFSRLPESAQKISNDDPQSADYILAKLRRAEKPYYPPLDDPILSSVVAAAKSMNNVQRFAINPTERGIVLFEAARKALQQAIASGRTGYMHMASPIDQIEITPDEAEDDIPDYAFDE